MEPITITEKDPEFFSIAIIWGWITYNESDPITDFLPWIEANPFRLCRELDCKEIKVVDHPHVELHFIRNNSTVMAMEIHSIHCRGGLVWEKYKDVSEHFFGYRNKMLQEEEHRKRARSPKTAADRILKSIRDFQNKHR